jgi:shikimate dehydrogenase
VKFGPETKIFLSVSSRPGTFGASVYNELFLRYGVNAVYLPRSAPDARSLCSSLRALQISGCSVSTPLKSEVIPFLDRVEPEGAATGSVNTILNRDGVLVGQNTDVDGIASALEGQSIQSVRIFGAGSVVHSLIHVLQKRGVKRISIAARNPKSKKLIMECYSLEEDAGETVDLLINATPASLDPTQTELFRQIDRARGVFDLVVAGKHTPLIEVAASAGKKTISGVEMAKGQLRKQFEIYTGIQVSAQEISEIVSKFFI